MMIMIYTYNNCNCSFLLSVLLFLFRDKAQLTERRSADFRSRIHKRSRFCHGGGLVHEPDRD